MTQNSTTSDVSPGHPVRGLEGLARAIALPSEFKPQRFPSFPSLERTATMGFTQPSTLAIPTGRDTKVFLARQAAYPLWGQVTSNADFWAVTFTATVLQNTAAEGLYTYDINSSPTNVNVSNRVATASLPGFSGVSSTFTYPVLGEDPTVSNVPFVYLPENWNAYIIINFNKASTTMNTGVSYETWYSPGQTTPQTTQVNSSTVFLGGMSAAIKFTSAGQWLRITHLDTVSSSPLTPPPSTCNVTIFVTAGTAVYSGTIADAGTATITGADSIGTVPLVTPSEFVNSAMPWFSTRMTAVGALFTNVTQVLNKGGTIMAGRVPPNAYSPWAVTKSYVNGLHPAEKAFLPLESGLYTYCPPSTDLADFFDYVSSTGGGTAGCPLYRLDNTSLVNVAFFTPGSVAESLAINCSWHMEFRTASALFEIGMCQLTLETLHQAQLALSQVGFFFHNPNHSAILRMVIQAARNYLPVLARAALGVGFKVPRKSRSNSIAPPSRRQIVPPTSGQASGIVSKRAPPVDMRLAAAAGRKAKAQRKKARRNRRN